MMLEVEEVWQLIDELCGKLPTRRVPLADALHGTLAEPALADEDSPPFDRAMMDGYAIRRDDDSKVFSIVATIAPGESGGVAPRPGEAVRILTGAMLPGPGLQVIMQEDAELQAGSVRIRRRSAETFIAARGEDVRAGQRLLEPGTRLGAVELAMLAAIGQSEPRIIRPAKILHFTSGNEVVPAAERPRPGQIRNTNAPLIRALAADFPMEEFRHVHLPDDAARGAELIAAAEPEAFDLLLFSGGASSGDHDFTRRYLRELGFVIRCEQVNVRPGKPLVFATNGARVAFGLPGNPVSHFVCFHLFVARALARMMGREFPALEEAELAAPIPGGPNRRVTFWPARRIRETGRECVSPVPWNSSGHLASLPGVDALIRLAANVELPKPGAAVSVFRLEAR